MKEILPVGVENRYYEKFSGEKRKECNFLPEEYKEILSVWVEDDLAGLDSLLVADLACGFGDSADYLEKNCGCRVIRLDLCEKLLQQQPGLRLEADLSDLPFKTGCLDAIHFKNALVHVAGWQRPKVFEDFHASLKKGGSLLINTISLPCKETEKGFIYYRRSGQLEYRAFSAREEFYRMLKELDEKEAAQDIHYPSFIVDVDQVIDQLRQVGFGFEWSYAWSSSEKTWWPEDFEQHVLAFKK